MGLIVTLQTEHGNVLERVEDRRDLLSRALPDAGDAQNQWASTIDLYGDTTFNYLQAAKLRTEWQRLMQASHDSDTRELLERIDDMLERCSSRVHTYVKFSGD